MAGLARDHVLGGLSEPSQAYASIVLILIRLATMIPQRRPPEQEQDMYVKATSL